MRRLTPRGLLLCIFALWVHLLAPVAAEATAGGVDPFSIICSHDASGQGTPAQGDHGGHHEHCLLCPAAFGSPPLTDRTPDLALRRAVVRRLSWRPGLARAPPIGGPRYTQPRGPPSIL